MALSGGFLSPSIRVRLGGFNGAPGIVRVSKGVLSHANGRAGFFIYLRQIHVVMDFPVIENFLPRHDHWDFDSHVSGPFFPSFPDSPGPFAVARKGPIRVRLIVEFVLVIGPCFFGENFSGSVLGSVGRVGRLAHVFDGGKKLRL